LKVLQFIFSTLFVFLCAACSIEDQQKDGGPSQNDELFQTLKKKDSLVFEIGFNQIDTNIFTELIAEDFEFYHDINGITDSKADFLNNIESLRSLEFKTWRTLKEESMEVFPLYTNNKTKMYGAIQNGTHEFYQQKKGEKARKTSIAKFSHLWILVNDHWKLKRVLSYDHQEP
jgi:hypothetical protein